MIVKLTLPPLENHKTIRARAFSSTNGSEEDTGDTGDKVAQSVLI